MTKQQKVKDKIEIWTSKLGGKFPMNEIDFDATAAEIVRLKNQPANRRCADCGAIGTVWSSVNLGVFTCMRCGSLHRALGTHISKPKGCVGTYLWGPDEVQRMKDIGNARAEEIYGGKDYRPDADAPHDVWLEYVRDKYERRRWANATMRKDGPVSISTQRDSAPFAKQEEASLVHVQTQDLLELNSPPMKKTEKEFDFFAEFSL